jgi:diguanylate cyclase (GGDEF)-like protein
MRDLSRPARIYISGLLAWAFIVGLADSVVHPIGLHVAPLALLLLACASVAQLFKVTSPKHQSYYTTSIFYFGAALLLKPAFLIVIVVVSHLIELLRTRYRWYIQAFNIANFVVSGLAARAVFIYGRPDPIQPDLESIIRAVIAGLVFVAINHLLTVLVIMWARRVPISKAGTLDWENVATDLALTSVGGLGALLWMTNPWMVPLTLGPLFLIYRSLLVPTLQEEARSDPKTELFNMKHFNQVASAEVERAARFSRPLSVLLADLDLLREVNNKYGHMAGDQLIRRVADVIRQAVREYDLPARFGGDEFAVLMPEARMQDAAAVAERIRRDVSAIDFKAPDGSPLTMTVSVGIALFPAHGRNPAELLAAADRAVYRAKALGRNRVCGFTDREGDAQRSRRVAEVLPAATR